MTTLRQALEAEATLQLREYLLDLEPIPIEEGTKVRIAENSDIFDCCKGKTGRVKYQMDDGFYILQTNHICPVHRHVNELEVIPQLSDYERGQLVGREECEGQECVTVARMAQDLKRHGSDTEFSRGCLRVMEDYIGALVS